MLINDKNSKYTNPPAYLNLMESGTPPTIIMRKAGQTINK